MDADKTFRQEVSEWLKTNCPEAMRRPPVREEQVWAGRNQTFPNDDARIWFERMRDKRWIVPDWPIEYGGAGLSESRSKILNEEMKSWGCRAPLMDLGIWMLGPALLEYGNEAQKNEHLVKIARGEIRWCQGYSEPGAGSDLASLQCKAEDKGDHFLVNGSKIWTTNADKSDWIFCLVRTNPDVKKQEGISFLLIDMESQGVSTSPIELISGESEFCQTFFDNVKVPKDNLVGELNKGWSVAKALLKHERKLMSASQGKPGPNITPLMAAEKYVEKDESGKIADHALRDQLVKHEMKARALALTQARSFEEQASDVSAGTIPMIMKYVGTESSKNKEELLLALMGAQALGWEAEGFSIDEMRVTRGWLYSKALSIAGGSSEVQLNIIAKRILGLPD